MTCSPSAPGSSPRLPRPVPPFPGETTASYVYRLARANRLDDDALRAYATGDPRKSVPIPVRRLAILSGQNEHALRHALPDLESGGRRDRNRLVRYACRWCTAARIIGWASIYLQPQDVVCLRHRRWIGDNRTGQEHQPSLAAHPEILHANKRHRRIIRATGPAAARSAYNHARWVCDRWRQRRIHMHQFERLLDRFHPPEVMIFEADPTVEACAYPQIVALTPDPRLPALERAALRLRHRTRTLPERGPPHRHPALHLDHPDALRTPLPTCRDLHRRDGG